MTVALGAGSRVPGAVDGGRRDAAESMPVSAGRRPVFALRRAVSPRRGDREPLGAGSSGREVRGWTQGIAAGEGEGGDLPADARRFHPARGSRASHDRHIRSGTTRAGTGRAADAVAPFGGDGSRGSGRGGGSAAGPDDTTVRTV